jgi:hypothetical protein
MANASVTSRGGTSAVAVMPEDVRVLTLRQHDAFSND